MANDKQAQEIHSQKMGIADLNNQIRILQEVKIQGL